VSVSGDWIPTAAFIEHDVLEEALGRDVTIKQASATVVPRFGLLSNGAFLHRQTRLLGMLYTLLVFPRERWKRDGLLDVIVERARADSELSAANKKLVSVDFIRGVRNALTHARADFTADSVTCRDDKTEESLTFEVMLSIRKAMNIVLVLGRAFHEGAQGKETLANVGRSKP
jgi:hypothetical protein